MSQFESHFDQTAGAQPARSKLAILALVCSLIVCIPVLTFIGLLLGVVALTKTTPGQKGRGLAITAIILGVIATPLNTLAWFWLIDKGMQSYALVLEGPGPALSAGFAGDIAGFESNFYAPGAPPAADDATAFVDALRTRYGEYLSCAIDETGQQPQFGQLVFPYQITFDQKVVDCEAEIVVVDQQSGDGVMKLGYMIVSDDELGDLEYPPPSSP